MRGIEGMPFRYIVLALTAVLIIGFVIQFTNNTTKGLNSISGDLIAKVKQQEEVQTDVSGPTIGSLTTTPKYWETCFEVKVKDPSGVSFVSIRFDNKDIVLNKEGEENGWELWDKCVENYNHGTETVTVFAVDNSPHKNYSTKVFTVNV